MSFPGKLQDETILSVTQKVLLGEYIQRFCRKISNKMVVERGYTINVNPTVYT